MMTPDLCRLVRDQAFKAAELFVKRLETHASIMVGVPFIRPVCIAYTTLFTARNSGEGANPLWNDDLININADEGDWSTFL